MEKYVPLAGDLLGFSDSEVKKFFIKGLLVSRIPDNLYDEILDQIDSHDKIPQELGDFIINTFEITDDDIIHKATSKSYTGSGIYFLLSGVDIVYIGQSQNLGNRISIHRHDKRFDRVFVVYVDMRFLDFVESVFIMRYAPVYNRVLPNSRHLITGFFTSFLILIYGQKPLYDRDRHDRGVSLSEIMKNYD